MKSVIILLFLVAHSLSAVADTKGKRLDIINYTSRNGLSQNTVRCILQDSIGYMWFGTTNGISRFDGYSFKTIMLDSIGDFRDNRINGLTQKGDGLIMVNSFSDSYYCYSTKIDGFISMSPQETKDYAVQRNRSEKERMKKILTTVFGKNVPAHVNPIQDECDFTLFSGSRNGSVWIYDKIKKEIYNIMAVEGVQQESERYRAAKTGDDTYWITTLHHGLVRYNSKSGHTDRFTVRDGLSSNNLRCIVKDRAGDLWVGTNEHGAMRVRLSDFGESKKILDFDDSDGNTMEIRMSFTDSDNRGWFGAHDSNSNIYIYENGQTKVLTLPNGYAYCGLELPDGDKLIGTKNRGIFRVDKEGSRVIENISGPKDTRLANDIYGMVLDDKRRLWTATHGAGVQLYLLKGDSYGYVGTFKFNSDDLDHLRSIVKDRNGKLWLASNNGIISFHPDSLIADPRSFSHFNVSGTHGTNNGFTEVRCLFIDKEGTLWIGTTGKGIYYADIYKNPDGHPEIFHLNARSDSDRSIVQSIGSDRKGTLWVAFENYLAYIRDNYRLAPTGSIVSLDINDDLTFSENSLCAAAHDSIYAGCNDGVLIVGTSVTDNKKGDAEVFFSGLRINGEEISPSTKDSPLKVNINETRELRLKYWQNSIQIDCTTLDYNMMANSGYYYAFSRKGDKGDVWIAAGGNNVILNGLQPDTYYLKVRCYNGTLSDVERVLKIVVTPPWWKTWWAYTGYFIIVVGTICLAVFIWMRRQREKAYNETERKLAEYKLRFFSRVSHDLRTPLTIIQGFLETLPQNEARTTYSLSTEKMGILHRNADKLLQLVDKVLSFKSTHSDEDLLQKHILETAREADAILAESPLKQEEPERESDSDTSGYRILVVDDNDDMREMLRMLLEKHFTVYTATNGKDALALMPEVQPDLIVCDVMMPEMDGIEFTSHLRSDFNISHIPVILLTASVGEETHLSGIEVGADAFLTKPFDRRLLYARIRGLIRQRHILQNHYATDPTAQNPLITVVDRDRAFVDRINQLIADNLGDPDFKIDNYAADFNVGRTTLFAKIKAVLGYTPHEYVRLQRMKKAAELLLSTELNVSEICYQVGINDPFYFSRLFKQVYKKSPSQFRKDGWATQGCFNQNQS